VIFCTWDGTSGPGPSQVQTVTFLTALNAEGRPRSERYTCYRALANTTCFLEYESCVSCCQAPEHTITLQRFFAFLDQKNNGSKRMGRDDILLSVENNVKRIPNTFIACRALCRTASFSIVNREYSSAYKYCIIPPNSPQSIPNTTTTNTNNGNSNSSEGWWEAVELSTPLPVGNTFRSLLQYVQDWFY